MRNKYFISLFITAFWLFPAITSAQTEKIGNIYSATIGAYSVKRPADIEELFKNGRGFTIGAAKTDINQGGYGGFFLEYINVPLDDEVFFRNSGVLGGKMTGGAKHFISFNLFLKFRLMRFFNIYPYVSAAGGRVYERQEETTLIIGDYRASSAGSTDGYFSSHISLGADFQFINPLELFVEFSVLTYYTEKSNIQFIPVKAGIRYKL